MSGRKPEAESRSAEFCQRLIVWKQTPESLRPSLRALARELRTSHQLLEHYLDGLEIRQAREEQAKRAREYEPIVQSLRARARQRDLTPWEQEQFLAYERRYMRATAAGMLLRQLENVRQKAKKEPLNWWDIKKLSFSLRASSLERKNFCRRVKVKPSRSRKRIGRKNKADWNPSGKARQPNVAKSVCRRSSSVSRRLVERSCPMKGKCATSFQKRAPCPVPWWLNLRSTART